MYVIRKQEELWNLSKRWRGTYGQRGEWSRTSASTSARSCCVRGSHPRTASPEKGELLCVTLVNTSVTTALSSQDMDGGGNAWYLQIRLKAKVHQIIPIHIKNVLNACFDLLFTKAFFLLIFSNFLFPIYNKYISVCWYVNWNVFTPQRFNRYVNYLVYLGCFWHTMRYHKMNAPTIPFTLSSANNSLIRRKGWTYWLI